MLIIHLVDKESHADSIPLQADSDPNLSYPNHQPVTLTWLSAFGLFFLTASWNKKEEKEKAERKNRKIRWTPRPGIKRGFSGRV